MAKKPPPDVPENPKQVHSSMAAGVTTPVARTLLFFFVGVGAIWVVLRVLVPATAFSAGGLIGTLFLVFVLVFFFVFVAARI